MEQDKKILLEWATTYGEDKDDVRAAMYGEDLMIEFAKYYHTEQLKLCEVSYQFNEKHTANHDRKKCNCQELAFKVDSLKIENDPEAEQHLINDRLVCYFKH